MTKKTNAIAKSDPQPASLPAIPAAAFRAQLHNDWSGVSDEDKIRFASSVCRSLSIPTPLNPFKFIPMKGGKVTFYAGKEAAELLAERNKISVEVKNKYFDQAQNIYVVECRAQAPDVTYFKNGKPERIVHGRHFDNFAAISMAGKTGDDRANAMMKCMSKAIRRTVFSAVGLSIMDEDVAEYQNGGTARSYPVPPEVPMPSMVGEVLANGAAATEEERDMAEETIEARTDLFQRAVQIAKLTGEKNPAKGAKAWIEATGGKPLELLSADDCQELLAELEELEQHMDERQAPLPLDEVMPPPPKGREPGSEG